MKAAFDDADMRGASFVKARMNLSNFQRCRLDQADLRGIRGAMLSGEMQIGGMQLWMKICVQHLERSGLDLELFSLKPSLKDLLVSNLELVPSPSHHSFRHIL